MTGDQILSVNAIGWAFGAGFGCASIIVGVIGYFLLKDRL